MKRYAIYLLCAAMTAAAVPASAQSTSIPAGQSCGGLLCDVGVFGHKVPTNANGAPPTQEQLATAEVAAEAADPHRLACHDFVCGMFQKRADQAQPEPAPVAQAAVPEAPAKPARKAKRRHVAKADTAATESAK